MTKPKAINRKKLVAFVLLVIAKGVDPMPNEKLERLKHDQQDAERKLTTAKHKGGKKTGKRNQAVHPKQENSFKT